MMIPTRPNAVLRTLEGGSWRRISKFNAIGSDIGLQMDRHITAACENPTSIVEESARLAIGRKL